MSIRHIVANQHGVVALDVDPDGGLNVITWDRHGHLDARHSMWFHRSEARIAARFFHTAIRANGATK